MSYNKYNCTYNSGNWLYMVSLVAENEMAAKDMAFHAAKKEYSGSAVRWISSLPLR